MRICRSISAVFLFALPLIASTLFSAPHRERAVGAGWFSGTPQAAQTAQTKTITLLDTTDSHGHIMPWDYYTNRHADLGLAKIATLVKQARADAPDALLLDCGDTIEGTPFAYYFAREDTT